MGCDIHCILERRYENRWVGVNLYEPVPTAALEIEKKTLPLAWVYWRVENRNYHLFSRLAGVRGPGPAARGIPPDVSDLARAEIESWGVDGHSHSWGLLTEIGGLFLAAETPAAILDPDRLEMVSQLFGLTDTARIEEHRLVYFFDN